MLRIVTYSFFDQLHVSVEALWHYPASDLRCPRAEPLVVGVLDLLDRDDPVELTDRILQTVNLPVCQRAIAEHGGLLELLT
jgi:hypothetical protein